MMEVAWVDTVHGVASQDEILLPLDMHTRQVGNREHLDMDSRLHIHDGEHCRRSLNHDLGPVHSVDGVDDDRRHNPDGSVVGILDMLHRTEDDKEHVLRPRTLQHDVAVQLKETMEPTLMRRASEKGK